MITIPRRVGGALAMLTLVFGAVIGSAAAQTAFSDTKLDAFVTAALAVDDLVKAWTPRIDKAGSQAQADQLRTQANTELVVAVEAVDGMTVDEYRRISDAARQDANLAARIQTIVEQKAAD